MVVLLYLVYNISYGILSYPACRFSDRIGRKKVLVVGYFIFSLVYLGFAWVSGLPSMWMLFIIYGIYIALTEGVEKALLADMAPSHLRGTVIGLHAALVGVALLPASLIAGFLWQFLGASAPFYFGSGMGLLSTIGLLFILKGSTTNFIIELGT